MKKLLSISLIVATTLVAALNASTNRPLPETPREKLGKRTDLYKQQNEARYQKMQDREDEARMRRNMMPEPRVEENNPSMRAEWRKKGMRTPMNPLRQKQMNQPLVNPNEMRAMPYEDPNAPMQIMPYEDPNAPMNALPYENPNAPMTIMPHYPLRVEPGEMTIMPYTGDLNENEGMNVESSTSMFNQSNQDWLKNRQRVPLYRNQR